MIECETVARRWGNSIGITLPSEVVKAEHIGENEKVKILVLRQRPVLKQTFGSVRRWKKSAQNIKDELRKELHHA